MNEHVPAEPDVPRGADPGPFPQNVHPLIVHPLNVHPQGDRPCPASTTAPFGVAAGIEELSHALQTVKALLAAGIVDSGALGLPTATAGWNGPVPPGGTRIKIGELVDKTLSGLKNSNSLRTYRPYLTLLRDGWSVEEDPARLGFPGMADRWADEVLASELEKCADAAQRRTMARAALRAARRAAVGRAELVTDAEGTRYNAIGAFRRMFKVAMKDRHIAKGFDPSQEIDKPRRADSRRMALTEEEMTDAWAVVDSTGNDPELDRMIVETILVSGARREGLLNLTLAGLDRRLECVRLDEKFGFVFLQPVPDWLVDKLYAFAVSRGATRGSDAVFRLRTGRAMTSRRLDYLFQRIQASYEWADRLQVTAHTLRHHAITQVERSGGTAVSTLFARHTPGSINENYTKATYVEVARVLVHLYGGDHPLLHGKSDVTQYGKVK